MQTTTTSSSPHGSRPILVRAILSSHGNLTSRVQQYQCGKKQVQLTLIAIFQTRDCSNVTCAFSVARDRFSGGPFAKSKRIVVLNLYNQKTIFSELDCTARRNRSTKFAPQGVSRVVLRGRPPFISAALQKLRHWPAKKSHHQFWDLWSIDLH